MRAAPILLALAATACATHAAQRPRFDPATYAKLCQPAPDSATAKQGGCVLKDQGAMHTLNADAPQRLNVVRVPPQPEQ
jgi:hypothetical protein